MFASHPIFSRVRAAARRWVCVVVAGPLLGCGDPPPVAVSSSADVLPRATAVPTGDSGPPSAPASVAAPGEGELLPEAGVPTPENARTFVDLVSQAKRAHVRRDGPILDPAGPGWDRVAQLGDRKSWLPPPRNESARLAWPEGIGTTLAFPVGPEGPALRTGSIFLKAIAPNQRVTLFLDDVSLGTVAVPTQGRAVTFSLPEGGLAPGEHRLRLWFRFTRFIGKQRTPGGIGPVVLSAETRPGDAPVAWTGAMTLDGQPRPALLAGPPSAWTFYVWLPEQAHFTAEAVTGPVAVEFRVVVQGDASDPVDVGRLRVEPNARRKVDLDLSRFARQPVRLVLETRAAAGGGASTLETSGWVSPALRMPPLPDVHVPGARNVLVWAVDGLRADRVGLGRGGDRAATPNLDLLFRGGGAGDDVWSGAATADEGHRRLLRPDPAAASLPVLMTGAGRFTGYFGASPEIDPALVAEFTTQFDLRRTGEAPETSVLLRELGEWIDVRKRTPFFAYVTTTDPRQDGEAATGYVRHYAQRQRAELEAEAEAEAAAAGATDEVAPAPNRARFEAEETRAALAALTARYDAQVTATDYWVGQLMALLQGHDVLRDTAIVVVGTTGHALRLGRGDGAMLSPEVLRVPLVIWHPSMLVERPHGLMRGGDLGDAAATVLELAGVASPPVWRGRGLTAALLFGAALPPRADAAAVGGQVAARLGDWWLRGSTARGLQLWNLAEDPTARVDLAPVRPIALRLIRDAMQDEARWAPVVERNARGRTP